MNAENTPPSTTPEVSVVKKDKDNSANLHVNLASGTKKGKAKGHSRPSNYLVVASIDGKIVRRLDRKSAEKLVANGGYSFVKKAVWKSTVRDIKKNEVPVVAIDDKKEKVVVSKKNRNDKPRKSKEHKEEKKDV